MRLLVYGAGVLGSLLAARLHEAGHDVALLARGERLAALRRHGIQLAEEDSPVVRRVPVPVVEAPTDGYDLIAVVVRAHQIDPVLESVAGLDSDVLFLHAWAAEAALICNLAGSFDRSSARTIANRKPCASAC